MSVTVKIGNYYEDGHESTHEVVLDDPVGDIEQWFEEVVWEYTGDGHGVNMNSGYTAEIVQADNPNLIGQNFEWF